ncbi:MAG: pyridine nucleotide-disulfide oxidoreductase [Hyphomicrobiales bacterium]|nr:pyridine nucleotide-disulfide oxidoreductase [Hyphomicrobiales bacterium]
MSYQESVRPSGATTTPVSNSLVPLRDAQRPKPRRRIRLGEARARFAHYLSHPFFNLPLILFCAAILGVLYASWSQRNEGHLTPETGVGYWLGITGATIILILILYPLRKRVRFLRALGRVPTIFRLHMIFGIVGPTLIVVHSNWHLYSLNATVAMTAMLTVVASGIVGRYLYSKVHMGLYGRKAEVRQILADASVLKRALGEDLPQTEQLLEQLQAFEADVLGPRRSFLVQSWVLLTLGIRQRFLRNRLLRMARVAINKEGVRRGWSAGARKKRVALVREHLGLYFATTKKAARFGVYERLFAVWHMLHMPLFFLLAAAAVVHVIAVHLY